MRQLTKKEKVGVGAALAVIILVLLASRYIFGIGSATDNALVQSDLQSEQTMQEATTSATSTSGIASPVSTVSPAHPIKPNNPTQMSNTYTTADGLTITDVTVGTGAEAKAGDNVTVNYTGTFTNGQVFDSSLSAGRTPFSFTLGAGQVIAGWDEGVAGMKIGGERKLVIPPSLAYGPNDYGPIPGNSTLDFTVTLLGVAPATQ